MSERSIFLAAVEILDPNDRAAYLDAACKDDQALRARIDALLAAHASPTGFMSRPAAERDPMATVADFPPGLDDSGLAGSVLADRYVLGRAIGRGGMGTVYRAEQVAPVRRAVAVKLINPGMDSRQILARFEAERQALALMEHPNIARVLDAGATPGGRPFFVMELVDGVPLTDYCDSRRLSVADRLGLFAKICRAVQHAHRKGIIHRDLKPYNILVEEVDGVATPKVIDFGLAKAVGGTVLTDHSMHTFPGSLAGSPLYMAPEQAGPDAADVDVRADVYALGVVLYELLTGSTPIQRDSVMRAALAEVVRLVREEDPPSPSRRLDETEVIASAAADRATEPARLRKLLQGDLDRVAMKALEKDRERRYDSASAFADDVERFLNHEPVSAGPPTAAYRLGKFIRRHRSAVVAASLVFLTLVAGLVGTSWGLVRAAAERVRAERATDRAYKALDSLTEDALESLLGRQASWGDKERAYLGRIRDQFRSLADAEGDSETTRRMRASSQLRLGSIQSLFGDAKAAEADFRAAADEFGRLPSPKDWGNAAQAWAKLGGLLSSNGDAVEGRQALDRANESYRLLIAEHPDASYRLGAAKTLNDSGYIHAQAGDWEPAEADCRRAADGLAGLAAEHPDDPIYVTERARALHNLYMVLRRTARPEEARRTIGEVVGLLQKADKSSNDPRVKLALGSALQSRVAMLMAGDDYAGAEPVQREVIKLHSDLASEHPAVPTYLIEVGRGQVNLGILYGRLNDPDRAAAAYRDAVSTSSRLVDRYPDVADYEAQLATARLGLGEELSAAGRNEEAEKVVAEALSLWEKLHARVPGSPAYAAGVAAALARIGSSAYTRQDFARAAEFLVRADRFRRENANLIGRDPMGPPVMMQIADTLPRAVVELGDHAKAAVAADELAAIDSPNGPLNAYNAGCFLSRCSSLAAKDEALPPERRAALAEGYAVRAVAHLRTAVARGFADAPMMAADTDLAPLRERADYKEVAAKVK